MSSARLAPFMLLQRQLLLMQLMESRLLQQARLQWSLLSMRMTLLLRLLLLLCVQCVPRSQPPVPRWALEDHSPRPSPIVFGASPPVPRWALAGTSG